MEQLNVWVHSVTSWLPFEIDVLQQSNETMHKPFAFDYYHIMYYILWQMWMCTMKSTHKKNTKKQMRNIPVFEWWANNFVHIGYVSGTQWMSTEIKMIADNGVLLLLRDANISSWKWKSFLENCLHFISLTKIWILHFQFEECIVAVSESWRRRPRDDDGSWMECNLFVLCSENLLYWIRSIFI